MRLILFDTAIILIALFNIASVFLNVTLPPAYSVEFGLFVIIASTLVIVIFGFLLIESIRKYGIRKVAQGNLN
jgi:hypothetical protein